MYNNNGTKQLIIIKNYNYVSRSNEKKYSNYVTQVSDNHIIIVYVYIFFLFTHNMPVFIITMHCIMVDSLTDKLNPLLNFSLLRLVPFPRSLQVISFEVLRSETGMRGDHNGGYCKI